MSKSLTAALALAAGMAGGLASRYIAPPTAHAQAQQQPPQELRSQSFVLVDASNEPIGTFTFESPRGQRSAVGSRIVLRNAAGREIWSAGGTGIHPVTER
jgi:hypothetical protein